MSNIFNYEVNYNKAESIRNTKYFKKTNVIWNKHNLNSSYFLGNLMCLIQLSNAKSPKEFEEWYLKDGEQRDLFLLTIPKKIKEILNNITLPKKTTIKSTYYQINTKHGRTKKYLQDLTYCFYNLILKEHPDWDINIIDVKNFVYIRIFYETYLGYQRENLTLKKLQYLYPYLTFVKTNEDFDIKYAVDVEVYSNKELICGLQIKSLKHKSLNKKTVLHNTKKLNNKKNTNYKRDYQKDVYYVFSEINGCIDNKTDIDNIFYKYNPKIALI